MAWRERGKRTRRRRRPRSSAAPRRPHRRPAALPAGPPPAARRRVRPKRRRGGKRRSASAALFYWGVVLALWALIAGIGTLVWIGIHLPPIQSLEIPKRPPSVLILGDNGATLATRGDMGGAAVPLARIAGLRAQRLHRHRGPPLLFALRHRSAGASARAAVADVLHRGASARRLDHHPAARQESVPHAGAHRHPQAAGNRAGALARTQIHQARRFSNSISTASISAPAPTASKPPRSAISASRRGN